MPCFSQTLRDNTGLAHSKDKKLAYFCSVHCPGDIILQAYDWARAVRTADLTIISGFQSPIEKDCLMLLLRGTVHIVVCPARGTKKFRVRAEWKKPIADGRLAVLPIFDDRIDRATAELATKRNEYVAAIADRILIAHAGKGSKTEELCKDAIAKGKPVFTLESDDNAHLVELGAIPVPATDPSCLLS